MEGLREAVAWKRGVVVLDEAAYPPRTFIESTASPINTEVTSQKRTPSLKDA
ncbi:MAG: hypothetical protein ACKO9A_17330 [Alphaproteobacteria bacterium]